MILAIDTSTAACTAALFDSDGSWSRAATRSSAAAMPSGWCR